MYSRDYFIEQFRETETDDLLDRIASTDLTDEAR